MDGLASEIGSIDDYSSYMVAYLFSCRPVVSLKAGVHGTYDVTTGIWSLSEVVVDELTEASITISYSTTEWTNEDVTVIATTNTSYSLQYSLDLETWYDGDSYDMTENGYIYFRLTDGDNVSNFYATGYVGNIDKTAATASANLTELAQTYISVSVSATDEESGIKSYLYSSDGGETYSDEITKAKYTFDELILETEYDITIKIIDNAGNETEISIETSTIGEDYVEYSIDLNGNGITTDDWRLFYVEDDSNDDEDTIEGQTFLIAADYLYFEESSNLNKYAYFYEDGDYSIVVTHLMETITNSLFKFPYDSYEDSLDLLSEYESWQATISLLNTENWSDFVDDDFANYAIGSPTPNLFVAAWNDRGYDEIEFELNDELEATGEDIDLSETDGYSDTTFFPRKEAEYGDSLTYCVTAYYLATPSQPLMYTDELLAVSCYRNNY